jgi:hypothetical protein
MKWQSYNGYSYSDGIYQQSACHAHIQIKAHKRLNRKWPWLDDLSSGSFFILARAAVEKNLLKNLIYNY